MSAKFIDSFELRVPASPEQIDVLADHLIYGHELGMIADEKQWMIAQVRKKYSNATILAANLDCENAEWVLAIKNFN